MPTLSFRRSGYEILSILAETPIAGATSLDRISPVVRMPTIAPNKGAPSLVLLLWLMLAVSMAGNPTGTWLCTLRLRITHTNGAEILHSCRTTLRRSLICRTRVHWPSGLRFTRMLTGCAFCQERTLCLLSERTPSNADANPTCAALHTIAGMGNFVRTAHMGEEVRVAMKGYLTTLKSQMATIAELMQCQALSPSASPSNSASLSRGIEGGASCGCDATGAACSGTAPCERRAGVQMKV
jgi:hypothetical protein